MLVIFNIPCQRNMFKYIFFCIFICALFFNADGRKQRRDNQQNDQKQNQDQNFEIFVLAQSWPQAICWYLNSEWSNVDSSCSPCKQTSSKSWTLHGLWPNNQRGEHPSFCEGSTKYNISLLDDNLKTQLQNKWPNFKIRKSDESYWNYEWKKHGTCASSVHSTDTMKKYFNKSLELLDKYNIGKIFEENSILPGHKYDYSVIANALENTLGVNGFVECGEPPQSKDMQYLQEIRVCFDKSFQLTNCNDSNSVLTNCKRNQQITYAENRSSC